MAEKVKKSFFETRLMASRIRSQTVSLFPEAGLGYLLGPILALFGNGVVNIWLVQYWHNVLGMGSWAPWFETIIPLVSSVVIIIGNLLVGRLMERKPSLAGKARPLILIGMPLITASLLLLFLIGVPSAAVEETIIEDGVTNVFTAAGGGLLVSILAAIGYNLFYAFAWPMYYTSHSALVGLSTRDGGKRGLLGTAVMAAQLVAAGISGIFGGVLVDNLGLLPVYQYTEDYALSQGWTHEEIVDGVKKTVVNVVKTSDFSELTGLTKGTDYDIIIHRADANGKWIILMIVMIAALIIGCLLEYFFTRERITEDNINNAANNDNNALVKKASMKEQIKICLKDKNWWMIMLFWALYQFGGMMKNNSMSFYAQAFTGQVTLSTFINGIGAIPTALGMVLVWPLAARFTKSKAISLGGIVAALGAAMAFSSFAFVTTSGVKGTVTNEAAISGISIASFCVKALGTAPAMYISLALMANVLDHQEAVHGVRTDGFTMAVYGSIMVAMSGICNGLIVGFNSLLGTSPFRREVLNTFFAFGVEGICYLAITIMFLFMNVEKFSNVDNKAIVFDQQTRAKEAGVEWVDPEIRNKLENEENDRYVEETRITQLKLTCEKKGLNFEEENAKYLAKKAEADKKAEEKKAAAEAKKQAKLDAMTPEQKQAMEEKAAAKKELQEKKDALALEELNKIREKSQKAPVPAE